MQIHRYISLLLIGTILLGMQPMLGQAQSRDTLIQRDLIMEKDYEPAVELQVKQYVLPELDPIPLKKRVADFSLTENPAQLKGYYNTLPAPSLSIEYPAQQKWGYFSFGGGSKSAFVGDGQLNLIRKPKQTLDIRIMHQSIFGDITNSMNVVNRSYMNQNRLVGSYRLHLPNNELSVSLSQRYNAWNYYGGWKTSGMPLNANEVTAPSSQWLSDSEFSVGLVSKQANQNLSYQLGAEGHLFYLGKGLNAPEETTKTKGGKESELTLKGQVAYTMSDQISLGANVQLTKLTYREPTTYPLYQGFYSDVASTQQFFAEQSWLQVNPFVAFSWKQWSLTTGLKVDFPSLESERVKWSPLIQGSTSLSDKAAFRVSLSGGVQVNTYRDGFEMNPYLDPFIHLNTAYQPINASAAIDYRPINNLRISPRIEYARTNNKAFFYNALPNTTDAINNAYGQLFSVAYMNENRISIGTEAYYNLRTKLRFFTQVQYNHYVNYSKDAAMDIQLEGNRKAWNQPGLIARLRIDASPVDKITTFVDFQIAALRYSPTHTNFMHRMDDIHDLSAGASWELARNVQVFVRLNNLLDQRYELWNGYQVHGFSALIGGYVTF